MASWSWEDVRKEGIKMRFPEYTETAHLGSVLYNGTFTTITFLKKKDGDGYLVVSSKAEHYYKAGNIWIETFYRVWKPTKDQGNNFYRQIRSTERVSKKGTKFYDLSKVKIAMAIDQASELKNCGRIYGD